NDHDPTDIDVAASTNPGDGAADTITTGIFTALFTAGGGTVSGGVATVSGTVAPGATWTLSLGGTPYSYSAAAGDTLHSVALALAAAINHAGSTFSASVAGATIAIATGNNLIVGGMGNDTINGGAGSNIILG